MTCGDRVGALLLAALALGAPACGRASRPAELVLLDGEIVTLDPETPRATALAARDGRIMAVGGDADVRSWIGEGTRVLRLDGRLAVPGFIEGHGHFLGVGRSLVHVDLRSAATWDEVVERAARAAGEVGPGRWVLGWGWHQDEWDRSPAVTVEGYPMHAALSAATPDNPVLLKHAAGNHAGIANRAALRRAGIDRDSADPDGGRILRDAEGEPTGVLRETAYRLALEAYERAMSERTAEQLRHDRRREIELAERECLSNGITTFHDAGSDLDTVRRLRGFAESGELDLRLWVMLMDRVDRLEREAAAERVVGAADDRFTVRAIKAQIDGALGTHGAWLLEPYADLPDSRGLNTTPLDEMERLARLAVAERMQLCVHAIGDRANRETLDLYAKTFAESPGAGRRWRIEHAQHLHPSDVPRFAELGVVASMQAVHCTSDAPWVPRRLGLARSGNGAYRWRDLLDSGAVVINGTDAPIEDVDPIANFHAAVTRRPPGAAPFHPEQSMTRLEALRSATIDAAYAGFEEDIKGSLRPGKLADVTVLSENILTIPEERILDSRVVYTIVGGRVAHEE